MTRRARLLWNGAVLLVVVAAVAGVYLLWHGQPVADDRSKKTARAVPEVRVVTAGRGEVFRRLELAGTVEPTRLAQLASPAEGPIRTLLVREGDRVRAGQLVLVIGRDRPARARLASDQEELRKAQDELHRVERLVKRGAVPGELLDKARADLERASASATAGGVSVSDFRVSAPWPGIVSRLMVREGNYVPPRTPLVELFDPKSLVVRIALPETAALSVSPDAAAEVRFDALPGRSFSARIERLYPELDRRLRTRTAELVVESPPPLAPGMFARVRLIIEVARDVVVVPATAVVTTSKQEQAFFVVVGEVARLRAGKVGIEDGARVQVLSGVAAGERVVVGGQQKLKDGTRVQIRTEAVKATEGQGRGPANPKGSRLGRP
jgi:membrane fusion protein (multidrug efflux system)